MRCLSTFSGSTEFSDSHRVMHCWSVFQEEERQFCQEEGREAPELEFEFIFDIGAFFSYYLINVSAFAEYAGINASLLRQYSCGLKSPTKATIDKIRIAIDNYKKDIAAGLLIDRPVPQYI